MGFLGAFLLIFLLIGNGFAATCPSGYDDVTNDFPLVFYSKSGASCPSGYESYTAPNDLSFEFTGMLLDTSPTLCGSGSHYVNGSCVSYTSDNCDSGYYNNPEGSAIFSSKGNSLCPSGYDNFTYNSNSGLSFVFGGILLANAPTLCSSGYYVNGTCSSYSSTGCITNYVDMGSDGVIAAIDANSSCPSGYDSLWSYQKCNASTTDTVCTTLCNGGMLETGAGYCSAACGNGLSVLHVGDSLTFPLYGTKTTQPSLIVANGSGQCYVNLAPGNTTGAIHIRYNNTIYHTTD